MGVFCRVFLCDVDSRDTQTRLYGGVVALDPLALEVVEEAPPEDDHTYERVDAVRIDSHRNHLLLAAPRCKLVHPVENEEARVSG